jgi:hypothetical protein
MDEWMIYASSGEYSIEAANAGDAYAQFTAMHDDDFVLAIVNEGMQPPLVVAENLLTQVLFPAAGCGRYAAPVATEVRNARGAVGGRLSRGVRAQCGVTPERSG